MSKHSTPTTTTPDFTRDFGTAPGIEGIITLADGTRSRFTIDATLFTTQFGADDQRLRRTSGTVDLLAAALEEHNVLAPANPFIART